MDSDDDAFEEHPHGEDDGQRNGQEQVVGQEQDAEDDLQDSGEHPAAAVGQEGLRAAGEDQFGDTGGQGEAADQPGRCEKGGGRFADADHAEGDEQHACYRQPDFGTFIHRNVY